MKRKFQFLGEMLAAMGVPLFDESIREVVGQFFDQIPEDLAPRRQNKIAATAILFSANTFIR